MKGVTTLDRSVGIELGGFVTDGRGSPVSLIEYLAQPLKLTSSTGFAEVIRDAGPDQIELVTDPTTSTLDLRLQLWELENLARRTLPGGDLQFYYLPRRPGRLQSGGESWVAVPRLRAMVAALCDPSEGNGHGREVYNIGDICAVHYHFGFARAVSEEGVLACNLLNLLAPTATEYLHERYGLVSTRRNLCWANFARPERLPGSRWFPNVTTFVRYFESIPRLIRPLLEDRFEVDLQSPQRISDEVSEGTTWWAARIRSKYNTVEFRPLPSVPPAAAIEVLTQIDQWLSEALTAVGSRQFENVAEAAASQLIPPFLGRALPTSDADWLHRWLRY